MDMFERISADIKAAMLARDQVRLETLRGIKKEFLEAKTAKGSDGTLSDETAVRIMTKMVKQRRETAEIYSQQNRPELAAGELAEAAVIEEYLPGQLSEEELVAELKKSSSRPPCHFGQGDGQGDGSGLEGACRTCRRPCHIGQGQELLA